MENHGRKPGIYECGEGDEKVVFEQKELVLGQIGRLFGLLDGVDGSALEKGELDLMPLIGEKLVRCAAIVLREEGKLPPMTDGEFEAFQEKVAARLTLTQTLEVVEDFFDITPISSLQEAIQEIIEKGREKFGILLSAASPGSDKVTRLDTKRSSGE